MQPLPLNERWDCVASCLIRGSSSHFKAHVLGVFCQRRVRGDAFVASLCCNPQWNHLTHPSGLPLQETILCSKMYLFSYSFWELCITEKKRTAKGTVLSPTAQQLHPSATSPSPSLCIFC